MRSSPRARKRKRRTPEPHKRSRGCAAEAAHPRFFLPIGAPALFDRRLQQACGAQVCQQRVKGRDDVGELSSRIKIVDRRSRRDRSGRAGRAGGTGRTGRACGTDRSGRTGSAGGTCGADGAGSAGRAGGACGADGALDALNTLRAGGADRPLDALRTGGAGRADAGDVAAAAAPAAVRCGVHAAVVLKTIDIDHLIPDRRAYPPLYPMPRRGKREKPTVEARGSHFARPGGGGLPFCISCHIMTGKGQSDAPRRRGAEGRTKA